MTRARRLRLRSALAMLVVAALLWSQTVLARGIALALPEAASAMKIFADINEAEAWLARPLDQIP